MALKNPDFYIIGPPDGKVLTLSSWLSIHPGITTRNAKFCGPRANDISCLNEAPETFDVGECRYGYASEWYMSSRSALSSIHCENPEAKFIVCLSNPIRTSLRIHQRLLASSRQKHPDFETAWNASIRDRRRNSHMRLKSDPVLDYPSVLAVGRQALSLMALFPRTQVQFVFVSDMISDPDTTWKMLCDFLDPGGDMPAPEHAFGPDTTPRVRSDKKGIRGSVQEALSDFLSDDIASLSVLTHRDLSGWLS